MQWVDNGELRGLDVDDGMRSWLLEPDLLTSRLRRQCVGAFSLRVLGPADVPALWEVPSAMQMQIRRVIMSAGEVPCIFAESILPLHTLHANPWLRTLGEHPLGERLKSCADVARGSRQYAHLDLREPRLAPLRDFVSDRWPGRNLTNPTEIWARRSKFDLGGSELWVAEVFLPGLFYSSEAEEPSSA